MKSFAQFVGFTLIIIGGFWVGMQWGSVRPAKTNLNPIIPEVPTKAPIVPIIVPVEEPSPVEMEEKPAEVEPSTPVTNTTVDPNLPTNKTDKVVRYDSSRFKYGFEMPANVYFSAFAGEAGAVHTVGIAKEDPETLADAAVRVYFYGKKVVPELQNVSSGRVVDPAGTFIYLLLNNEYSVKIEALNINNSVVQKIIETIQINV
jgi:hypothetical protein